MRSWFEIEYEETPEILADMHHLYLTKQSAYAYKMTLLIGGFFILFISTLAQGLEFTSSAGIAYMAKYCVVWVLLFVAGHYVDRTVFAKINLKSAQEKGQRDYEKREKAFRGDMKVKARGGSGEKFSVTSHGETMEYSYNRVTKIFESPKIFAILVNIEHGNSQLVCFPKLALADMTEEEFRQFFIQKCVYVRDVKRVKGE